MSEFDNYKAIQTTLEKYTPREYVKTKVDQTDGTVIEYIEAWKVIELANNIFGEGGWSNFVRELKIIDNEYENGMFHVTSTCIVKIQLKTGTTHEEMGIGESPGGLVVQLPLLSQLWCTFKMGTAVCHRHGEKKPSMPRRDRL